MNKLDCEDCIELASGFGKATRQVDDLKLQLKTQVAIKKASQSFAGQFKKELNEIKDRDKQLLSILKWIEPQQKNIATKAKVQEAIELINGVK